MSNDRNDDDCHQHHDILTADLPGRMLKSNMDTWRWKEVVSAAHVKVKYICPST